MKYIDTSAFVKYYSEEYAEKGSDRIKEILGRAKQGNEVLISSVILIPEATSVFDKWARLKLLSREDFRELFSIFISDLKQLMESKGLVIIDIDSSLVLNSIEYIVRHSLAFGDSVHLFTALSNMEGIEEFICSDNALIYAAKKEGLIVWNPEM
ncbi:MAG: type II toxin-antitoxin system VapC family toxin [Candidatus Aenigmarchaeota archaeon]|nr:type II toxin-antitoxin system VapC family toxin [Candidatus Aenigmarchaeota archaeon]